MAPPSRSELAPTLLSCVYVVAVLVFIVVQSGNEKADSSSVFPSYYSQNILYSLAFLLFLNYFGNNIGRPTPFPSIPSQLRAFVPPSHSQLSLSSSSEAACHTGQFNGPTSGQEGSLAATSS